jgi:hypothetical protein
MLCLLVFTGTGCSNSPLRFAPSEAQKQTAFTAYQDALAVNASGAEPGSEPAGRLVAGTAAALAYTGIPADPEVVDYPAVAAQDQADAAKRPTAGDVFDSIDEGLSLGMELAILFGAGGVGFGGKKVLDWIRLAREKNTALKEIVQGNEIFKLFNGPDDPHEAVTNFKTAQARQSPATRRLVTELKPLDDRDVQFAQSAAIALHPPASAGSGS